MLAGLAALPAALPAAAATEPDPIYAAIEKHRVLSADFDAALSISARLIGPEFDAADAITSDANVKLLNHADILICSQPTSLAGVIALMRYASGLEQRQQPLDRREWNMEELAMDIPNWHHAFLNSLTNAVEEISAVR
jgi:hypothetical protein